MNYSFAGCGFLGIYHIGVASCLKEHVPQIVKSAKICGASAGALVACCFLSGCCLGDCTSFTLRLATKARSRALGPLHPTFDILRYLREGLRHILPHNAHEICSGRLFVSLTRVTDRESVIISEFSSKEELIQAVLCSAFVPFYCGLVPPTYRGVRYVDGGLSDNLPLLDENTVTVSPFAGESDICPTDNSANFIHVHLANTSLQFTARNLYRLSRALFPPAPEILSDMCKQGFDDTLKFLQKNNLLTCTRHLTIRSTIKPVEESELELDDKTDGNVEEHDDVDCNVQDCDECKSKVQGALINSLPPVVIAALQAACDSVNSGLLGYLNNTRTVQLVSILVTPWTLPADIVINYFLRFLEWLPYLPQDMRSFSQQLLETLQFIISKVKNKQKKYNARFCCQLAITEVTYGNQEHYHMNNIVRRDSSPYVRNFNIGFSVDIEANGGKPIDPLQHLQGQLKNDLEHMDIDKIEMFDENHDRKVAVLGENSPDMRQAQQEVFDTFDQCLHVSDQMESMLAYFYQDENKRQCYNYEEVITFNDVDSLPDKCVVTELDSLSPSTSELPACDTESAIFNQNKVTFH